MTEYLLLSSGVFCDGSQYKLAGQPNPCWLSFPMEPHRMPLWIQVFPLTSAGICQLCPAQEAQVPGASPHGLSVPKTQASSKVISVQCFLSIHCVVTSSIVWATHPYLGDKPNPNWNKHRLFYQTQTASLIDLKDPFH